MSFVYNFLQIVLVALGLPVIVLLVLCRRKYRGRIRQRLGFGLEQHIDRKAVNGRRIIWVHCLSVGEVTSSLPLIKGLSEKRDQFYLVFSAATRTGMEVVDKRVRPLVDAVIPAPLDFLLTIRKFLHVIEPDLFIQVETDFWPNWLWQIQSENIPAMLVNGRISQSSFNRYNRLRPFFVSIFQAFTVLSMQTEKDSEQMSKLGIEPSKILTLGNLKYDTERILECDSGSRLSRADLNLSEQSSIWICGSTHSGEEEIIFAAYKKLSRRIDDLTLIVAPRDPGRAPEIMESVGKFDLASARRTTLAEQTGQVLILDTIGELADCYALADIAFIGGSMVDCGGHNPLEAAVCSIPVLFGPHMEDFAEIARDLIKTGGGRCIHDADELSTTVEQILTNRELNDTMGRAAKNLVEKNSGVVHAHLKAIQSILHR